MLNPVVVCVAIEDVVCVLDGDIVAALVDESVRVCESELDAVGENVDVGVLVSVPVLDCVGDGVGDHPSVTLTSSSTGPLAPHVRQPWNLSNVVSPSLPKTGIWR